jgi:hypothetical protein
VRSIAKQRPERTFLPETSSRIDQYVALTPDPQKTREEELAERREREQEVLLREVDEAVRQDQFGSVVKRYGWAIGGAVVLGLSAFGGWLLWRDYSEGQVEQRSEKLVSAFDKLEAGQIDQAVGDLTALSEDGSTATAISAKLARAGIALRDSRQAEAVQLYDSIANDEDAPKPYRDLAAIRSVAIQFEQLDPQKVIDRLKPLATPGNPWFGSAGELVAMAYLKQGKSELAGPLFAAIAKDEDVPQTLRSRTRQIAGQLGYDAVDDVDQTLAQMDESGPDGAQAPAPAQ